ALSFFPLLPCGTLGFSSLEPNFFHHLGHDLFGGFRMLFEKLLRRFAALADSLTAERVPSTALLNHTHFTSKVDGFTVTGYSGSVKYIQLRFLDRRRHLVLHDFAPRPSADDIVTVFERADAANIHAN